MPPKGKRRRFERSLGKCRYRRLFVIAAEGAKTEPQYFNLFSRQSVIQVRCLNSDLANSPPQVLKRMENHLRKEVLKPGDQAWLVVDKDSWTDEQLVQLYDWAQTDDRYGFALSNPKFEYWLLLHFEDGAGITSSRNCSDRLKRHLPGYDKGVDKRAFNREQINEAICRARQRDTPPCKDWPRALGSTTVYKLVEHLLQD